MDRAMPRSGGKAIANSQEVLRVAQDDIVCAVWHGIKTEPVRKKPVRVFTDLERRKRRIKQP